MTLLGLLAFPRTRACAYPARLREAAHSVCHEISRLQRQAGDISAGFCQGCDETDADRVSNGCKHDGNFRCHPLGRRDVRWRVRNDHVKLDKFGDKRLGAIVSAFGPPIFDRKIPPVNPAQFTKRSIRARV